MDELRESSLLFSLESLLETERERVEREAREAEQRRADELQRVAELAQRRRLANQKEREARERREQLEREREQLERERLEAMKRATVERARIEAESQARLAELEQAKQHDLALARIREHASTTRYRILFGVTGAALVITLALGLVGFFGFVRPHEASAQARLRAEVSATEAKAVAIERALAAERSTNRALESRVAALTGAAAVASPMAPKNEPKPASPLRPPRSGVERGTGHDSSRGKPCTNSGDPLEKCLP